MVLPENKPIGAEIAACRPFLVAEIEALARLEFILALGTMAHATMLTALGVKRALAVRPRRDAQSAFGLPTAITARATTPTPGG